MTTHAYQLAQVSSVSSLCYAVHVVASQFVLAPGGCIEEETPESGTTAATDASTKSAAETLSAQHSSIESLMHAIDVKLHRAPADADVLSGVEEQSALLSNSARGG